jgi:hypothetical protein
MFFSINFGAIQNAVHDPGITPQKVWSPKTNTLIVPPAGRGFGRLNVEPLLDAGIGVATFYYGDIDPDYLDGFSNGIRARYLKPGETKRAADDWGSIAAWAWAMSRVEDYFETDKSVDARRVAIHGVSRLGKTVMWAGAHDQRFAAVIASCSGEGGAALSHRDYGETIAHLTAPTRYPYQFAENYAKYGGFPDTAPMDANMLIALIAPRPLLLQTGSTDDWSEGRVSGRRRCGPGLQPARQTRSWHRCMACCQDTHLHQRPQLLHARGRSWHGADRLGHLFAIP